MNYLTCVTMLNRLTFMGQWATYTLLSTTVLQGRH